MKEIKLFPKPVPLKKLIGPSFVILALGLGSGEVILWPYLTANYGLGIAWGAILGITFQYFMNMEIERYALVKGESVFVGIYKLFKPAVYWFIISTFVGFGLPGIIAASAKVMAGVLGVENFKWIAILFLVIVGLILSMGKTVYGMMERVTKIIILIGVPFVFLLAVFLATKTDWSALFGGMIGKGEGFWFLPEGISIATFLAAFAYSGAGGNLNLTQSIYIKEKGYGMGVYSQKIASLFAKKQESEIVLDGTDCTETEEDISRFKKWWRLISIEHAFVFWFLGAISMIFLMLLAYTTTHGLAGNAEGINFVINEGAVIGQMVFPFVGILFLVVVSIMLFQTQLGVMDSTSRIMAENLAIRKLRGQERGKINLSKIYYSFVWAQIAFGIILFLFNIYEPKTLIILGAVINAFAMFVHLALVSWLNRKSLPKVFRPGWIRKTIIGIIFIFFGIFSFIVLWDKVFGGP
ncbi:Nramp family divalent metal transporter [Patescibacteria group bacterium]|nr:Nramp family divalent metal transporter [Patescibacteria group bacterium]MBU1727799.1 Nramp family divalent metal transporter [Patescibacteria group bacterium]